MDTYSVIILVGFILSLLLGFLMGFGRVVKLITGGLVGVIFSVFVCVMFGGLIAEIPFVADLIAKGNAYFGDKAQILAKLNFATWIYYVILFLLVQIVRIILVKCIAKMFTPKEKGSAAYAVRNTVNRVLGLISLGATFVLVVFFVLAVVALFSDVPSVQTMLDEFASSDKTSIFYMLYKNNPIDFSFILNK